LSNRCTLMLDAWITGQESYGPYHLLNAVRSNRADCPLPAIVLRVEYYLSSDYTDISMDRTDTRLYHGGGLGDEITALVSLSRGIRLKAGDVTRRFPPIGAAKGDPRGRPIAYEWQHDVPVLPKTFGRFPILPEVLGKHSISELELLREFPQVLPDGAAALVQAARLYQDAVWMAELEPGLAWLLLVSALETAAGHWRSAKESPIERLRASRPDLETMLEAAGGKKLVADVAEQITPYMGATKKFIDFVIKFMPGPPKKRPAEWLQHPWDRQGLKKSLGKIYKWRCSALHGGIPFPLPMCMPPRMGEERPLGLATGTGGAVWLTKDAPMLLHTFEHIARGALLHWWRSMIPSAANA